MPYCIRLVTKQQTLLVSIDVSRLCAVAGTKYTVRVHRRATDTFSLTLARGSVDAVIRTLNDGGLLVQASSLHSIQ